MKVFFIPIFVILLYVNEVAAVGRRSVVHFHSFGRFVACHTVSMMVDDTSYTPYQLLLTLLSSFISILVSSDRTPHLVDYWD
jgi:hypothetical protein